MPIGNKSAAYKFCSDTEAPFGSITWIPFRSGGPERVTTVPLRLYKMIIVSYNDNDASGL